MACASWHTLRDEGAGVRSRRECVKITGPGRVGIPSARELIADQHGIVRKGQASAAGPERAKNARLCGPCDRLLGGTWVQTRPCGLPMRCRPEGPSCVPEAASSPRGAPPIVAIPCPDPTCRAVLRHPDGRAPSRQYETQRGADALALVRQASI
jgi:hypothetical protein